MNLLTANSAFELLRNFKEVSEETEKLVLAIVSRKHRDLTIKELSQIFESGIAGEYGKIYTLDPQTILSWIDKYEKNKNSAKDYLEGPLLSVNTPGFETIDWLKEANKCYQAFLRGISEIYFHHCVYDRMMLDDKIKLNAYRKFYQGDDINEIHRAQQKIIKEVFMKMKDQGLTYVYFIK
jgi:hypothetical protein